MSTAREDGFYWTEVTVLPGFTLPPEVMSWSGGRWWAAGDDAPIPEGLVVVNVLSPMLVEPSRP